MSSRNNNSNHGEIVDYISSVASTIFFRKAKEVNKKNSESPLAKLEGITLKIEKLFNDDKDLLSSSKEEEEPFVLTFTCSTGDVQLHNSLQNFIASEQQQEQSSSSSVIFTVNQNNNNNKNESDVSDLVSFRSCPSSRQALTSELEKLLSSLRQSDDENLLKNNPENALAQFIHPTVRQIIAEHPTSTEIAELYESASILSTETKDAIIADVQRNKVRAMTELQPSAFSSNAANADEKSLINNHIRLRASRKSSSNNNNNNNRNILSDELNFWEGLEQNYRGLQKVVEQSREWQLMEKIVSRRVPKSLRDEISDWSKRITNCKNFVLYILQKAQVLLTPRSSDTLLSSVFSITTTNNNNNSNTNKNTSTTATAVVNLPQLITEVLRRLGEYSSSQFQFPLTRMINIAESICLNVCESILTRWMREEMFASSLLLLTKQSASLSSTFAEKRRMIDSIQECLTRLQAGFEHQLLSSSSSSSVLLTLPSSISNMIDYFSFLNSSVLERYWTLANVLIKLSSSSSSSSSSSTNYHKLLEQSTKSTKAFLEKSEVKYVWGLKISSPIKSLLQEDSSFFNEIHSIEASLCSLVLSSNFVFGSSSDNKKNINDESSVTEMKDILSQSAIFEIAQIMLPLLHTASSTTRTTLESSLFAKLFSSTQAELMSILSNHHQQESNTNNQHPTPSSSASIVTSQLLSSSLYPASSTAASSSSSDSIVASVKKFDMLANRLNQLLQQRLVVSPKGWMRLMSLRNSMGRWVLNDELASYLGVASVADLEKDYYLASSSSSSSKQQQQQSSSSMSSYQQRELYGTAIALVALERLFPDDYSKWASWIDEENCRKFVSNNSNSNNSTDDIISAAGKKISELRIVSHHASSSQRQMNEEFIQYQKNAVTNRDAELKKWMQHYENLFFGGGSSTTKIWDPSREKLIGTVFTIIITNNNSKTSSTTKSSNKHLLQVRFPFETFARFQQEESHLHSLLPRSWPVRVCVRSLRVLQPIAHTLQNLLQHYYHSTNHTNTITQIASDDKTSSSSSNRSAQHHQLMSTLIKEVLPHSYNHVQTLLFEGASSLQWSSSSSAQVIAEFSERLAKAVSTLSQQINELQRIERNTRCLIEVFADDEDDEINNEGDEDEVDAVSSSTQQQQQRNDLNDFGSELLAIQASIEKLSPSLHNNNNSKQKDTHHKSPVEAFFKHFQQDFARILSSKLNSILRSWKREFLSLDKEKMIGMINNNNYSGGDNGLMSDDDDDDLTNSSGSSDGDENSEIAKKKPSSLLLRKTPIWSLENLRVSIRVSSVSSSSSASSSSSSTHHHHKEITVEPSLCSVRQHWISELNRCLLNLCGLPCPKGLLVPSSSSPFESNNDNLHSLLFFDGDHNNNNNNNNEENQRQRVFLLQDTYDAIEEKTIQGLSNQVKTWEQQYSLWNIDLEKLFIALSNMSSAGSSAELSVTNNTPNNINNNNNTANPLPPWISVVSTLQESAKKAFTTAGETSILPGCVVDVTEIQRSIQTRCRNIIARVMERFISVIFEFASRLRSSLQQIRNQLEHFNPSASSSSLNDCIGFISSTEQLSQFIEHSAPRDISLIQQAQNLLVNNNNNSNSTSSSGGGGVGDHKLPNGWIESAVLSTEYRILKDLFSIRKGIVDGKTSQLKSHLESTSASIINKIQKLEQEFRGEDLDRQVTILQQQNKNSNNTSGVSSSSSLTLKSCLKKLSEHYIVSAEKLVSDADQVSKSQRILFVSSAGNNNSNNKISSSINDSIRTVKSILEDAQSLSRVFEALKQVESEIIDMRELLFNEVKPKSVFQNLADVEKKLQSLSGMKTYLSHQKMLRRVQSLNQTNSVITDLRSNAFTAASSHNVSRYWQMLFSQINNNSNNSNNNSSSSSKSAHHHHHHYQQLTLGDVWDLDPVANHAAFTSVIHTAQGEFSLENFLNEDVRGYWESDEAAIERVAYTNNKNIQLVKGWNELAEKLADHLTALQSMKNSPHFKHFEEEAASWENKLTRVRDVSEILVDVQRRWLYLDGIFGSNNSNNSTSNNDIKFQLPQESYHYEKLSREFISNILPSSSSSSYGNDENNNSNKVFWLSYCRNDSLLSSLEKLTNELDSIEHALLAYLESQRAIFPRFYFVGDDDLLELLGSSNNIESSSSASSSLGRHLNSMFCGVNGLYQQQNDDDSNNNNDNRGVVSKEGEILMFTKESLVIASSAANNSDNNNKITGGDDGDEDNNNGRSQQKGIVGWLETFSKQLRHTLAQLISESYTQNLAVASGSSSQQQLSMKEFLEKYPAQVCDVALQISWSKNVEEILISASSSASSNSPTNALKTLQDSTSAEIDKLSESLFLVSSSSPSSSEWRLKLERIITMLVYQRDALRSLCNNNNDNKGNSLMNSNWLQVMRMYLEDNNNNNNNSTKQVLCRMADACFDYSYEYLGISERLVQTQLTDRAYLCLSQALHTKLGGAPEGPAGTGKTETVKALGQQLGRFVLVFNCDEKYDFKSIERIFVGVCEVGAWACFDEFNRLEERILSAVSQQILLIQNGLRQSQDKIDFLGRAVNLHKNVGIFITMNPAGSNYAGRSQLPDNLKQLFRPLSMAVPDRENIAEVMLFVRGFKNAEVLAQKVVPLFKLCREQLSTQAHYDFGLRALKSVLHAAGSLLRNHKEQHQQHKEKTQQLLSLEDESSIVLQALCETVIPKLVASDAELFRPLLHDVFPNYNIDDSIPKSLRSSIDKYCSNNDLVPVPSWIAKIVQLYKILSVHHGVMLVGPSGVGKSEAWKALFHAMVNIDSSNSSTITVDIIDPKCLTKDLLFGSLDLTTREWKDGIFTSLMRKFAEEYNQQQQQSNASSSSAATRHFILFDGNVDTDWVENLNSVLDDNKVLTIPTGERIPLPPTVQILFEATDLKHATLATVSRCGMVWFSGQDETLPLSSKIFNTCRKVVTTSSHHQQDTNNNYNGLHVVFSTSSSSSSTNTNNNNKKEITTNIISQNTRTAFVSTVEKFLLSQSCTSLIENCIGIVEKEIFQKSTVSPIMEWNSLQALRSVCSLFSATVAETLLMMYCSSSNNNNNNNPSVTKALNQILSLSLAWGLTAGFNTADREKLIQLLPLLEYPDPSQKSSIFEHSLVGSKQQQQNQQHLVSWELWSKQLPSMNSSSQAVESLLLRGSDVVIPTVDTLRHEWILSSWLRGLSLFGDETSKNNNNNSLHHQNNSKRGFLLCGSPGTGKTMTLTSLLNKQQEQQQQQMSSSSNNNNNQTSAGVSYYESIFLNFSSATSPALVLKALEPVTKIVKQSGKLIMSPSTTTSSSSSSSSSSGEKSSSNSTTHDKSASSNKSNNNNSNNKSTNRNSSTATKTLIVFCDEINLPSPDKYETQHVIQLLRQIIEHGGFYRPQDNAWISVQNIIFVGACNPPTDPGRFALSHRYLRWSPVLLVDFPTKQSLERIYSTYTRAILKRCTRVKAAYESLAKAMVEFYHASKTRFTPEIQKHYIYSPRELSRWVRSINAALEPMEDTLASTYPAEQLIRLAIHEGLRIFRDKLVTSEEQRWTDEQIDNAFKNAFGGSLPASVLKRPMYFSTLFSRHYAPCDLEKLRRFLQEKLRLFAEEEYDAQLVVFDAVCDHVLRIDRVLRQPHGHMLLVGASGVGKTSLSKFAAWMNNIGVFQVKTHRGYTLDNFQQDLRVVMKRAGCDCERVCFIFDESNILDAGFLEFMNALLASGDVPGLFEGEERNKLLQQIRESIKQLRQQESSSSSTTTTNNNNTNSSSSSFASSTKYIDINSDHECYNWFVSNVSRNLHVVFTMNPDNADFSSRTATSPALFNRCVVDWFGDWDAATMVHVASELTSKVPIGVVASSSSSSSQQQSPPVVDPDDDEEEMLRGFLATSLYRFHEGVSLICDDIRKNAVSSEGANATFTTPRHFIDVIHQFKSLFKEKRDEIIQLQRHLNAGLSKLAKTSSAVDAQMSQLEEKKVILATTNKEAQEMLDRIVEETQKAEKAKGESSLLAIKLSEEEKQMAAQKKEAEEQLSGAQPALEAAANALSTIKPEYLREIRAYSKPPVTVKNVLEAVVTVLGEKQTDWDTVKSYIRRDDFIALVRAFQPSDVSQAAQDHVKRNYLTDPKFTPEEAMKASRAAGPLVQWVQAQCRFAEINVSIKPLRESIDILSKEVKEKRKVLEETRKQVAEFDNTLTRLKEDYQETLQKQSTIKTEIETVETRCSRANKLVVNLRVEKDRWGVDAGGLRSQVKNQLGDTLMCAAFISYAGSLDEKDRRDRFFPLLRNVLSDADIEFSENLDMVEYLTKPAVRAQWHSRGGLPQDTLCLENATILSRSRRYGFVVDPSGQATDFLNYFFSSSSSSSNTNNTHQQSSPSKKQVTQTSFAEKNLLKTIEMSVRFGNALIIHDAEQIDPMLNPLLNKEWRKSGGRIMMRLASLDIDVSPGFRMALVTRDSYSRFSPDLCGRVSMINFTTTLSSLSNQFLQTILKSEKPDVARVRADLTEARADKQFKLRGLEEQLLDSIAAAESDILENDSLIQSLENLKKESTTIMEQMTTLEAQLDNVRQVERSFSPLAECFAKSHFALGELGSLHTMYRYSLALITSILGSTLMMAKAASSQQSSGNEDSSIRKSMIVDQFFRKLHQNVARGLFEQDRLPFQLRLAQLRSELSSSSSSSVLSIPQSIWNFLILGSTKTTTTTSPSSSSSSEQQYKNLPAFFRTSKMSDSSTTTAASSSSSSSSVVPLSLNQFNQLVQLQLLQEEQQQQHLVKKIIDSFSQENDEQTMKDWKRFFGISSSSAADNNNNDKDHFNRQASSTDSFAKNSDQMMDDEDDSTTSSSSQFMIPKSLLVGVSSTTTTTSSKISSLSAAINLCCIKILKPDQLIPACELLISSIFDTTTHQNNNNNNNNNQTSKQEEESFLSQKTLFDLQSFFFDSLDRFTPALLVSFAGFDPSPRIETLFNNSQAKRSNSNSNINDQQQLSVTAMGSPESLKNAQINLEEGLRNGNWVVLLNVHFSPELLNTIEKRLHSEKLSMMMNSSSSNNNDSSNISPNFRLILVCEQSPVIPASLCKISRLFVFEAPKGVKANMRRCLTTLINNDDDNNNNSSSTTTMTSSYKKPAELPRVLFVLSWIHSVIIERLRYLPVGWGRRYEFSDSDFLRAVSIAVSWIQNPQHQQLPTSSSSSSNNNNNNNKNSSANHQRDHVKPSDIPWSMICQLILVTTYGGRIDDATGFDFRVLNSMLQWCLNEKMFDSEFSLAVGPEVNCDDGVSNTLEQFLKNWVENDEILPDSEPPEWLGLPSWATQLTLAQRGRESLQRWNKIQPRIVSSSASTTTSKKNVAATTSTSSASSLIPRNLQQIHHEIESWLSLAKSVNTQKIDQVISRLLMTTSSSSSSSSSSSNNSSAAIAFHPLVSCISREVEVVKKGFKIIIDELSTIVQFINSSMKQANNNNPSTNNNNDTAKLYTNELRNLVDYFLSRFQVPAKWSALFSETPSSTAKDSTTTTTTSSAGTTNTNMITSWLASKQERIDALSLWIIDNSADAPAGGNTATTSNEHQYFSFFFSEVPLGSFFFPSPFLTATRQHFTRTNKVAIEKTKLKVSLMNHNNNNATNKNVTIPNSNNNGRNVIIHLRGMHLEGAATNPEGVLVIPIEENVASVPVEVYVEWTRQDDNNNNNNGNDDDQQQKNNNDNNNSSSSSSSEKTVTIPVYRTQERREVLFEAEVPVDTDIFDAVWLQRRVCLIASTRNV